MINHAVNKHVRAFFHRRARGLELCCVHGDTNLVGMTLFDRRPDDRPKGVDRMILVDDVPDLHQIRFLFRQFTHELACLVRRVDLNDWRIAEIEFLARDT
jgi:hypothetical protein